MSQANVRENIEMSVTCLKSAAIVAVVSWTVAVIFYGVSIALGATPEPESTTEVTGGAETFGNMVQAIAGIAAAVAFLSTSAAAIALIFFASNTFALKHTPEVSGDREDKERRSRPKVQQQRWVAYIEQLDPKGKWW